MAEAKFVKAEAIRYGWDTVKENLGFFLKVVLLSLLVMLVPIILVEVTRDSVPALSFIFNIISYVVNGFIFIGMFKIALKYIDNEPAELADLFSGLPLLLPYIGASIIYSVVTLIGLVLLIVPGIILSVMLMFYTAFIVDKNSGPIEALKQSMELTKGSKWNLFLLTLLLILINILGVIVIFIGLLITIPLSVLAIAYVYRKLLSQSEGALDMGAISVNTKA